MSAETLRRAAALMRERAWTATPGPWSTYRTLTHRCIKSNAGGLGARVNTLVGMSAESKSFNAEHLASWHPAVALAVADWIDSHARDLLLADGHLPSCDSPGDVEQALAVARAYLGDST